MDLAFLAVPDVPSSPQRMRHASSRDSHPPPRSLSHRISAITAFMYESENPFRLIWDIRLSADSISFSNAIRIASSYLELPGGNRIVGLETQTN